MTAVVVLQLTKGKIGNTLMMGVPIILSESEIFRKHPHFLLIGYMLVTRLSNHWYELPSGRLGKDEVGGSNPPSSSKTETTRQGGFLFWQAALRSRSLSP